MMQLMKKVLLFVFILLSLGLFLLKSLNLTQSSTDNQPSNLLESLPVIDKITAQQSCNLPDQPKRIGLQVGHWKNEELPEELARLRGNTGAAGGGKIEWEVVHAIASLTKADLETNGYLVDLIPATVPPGYCAHAFISIHPDSSTDPTRTGYKAAAFWRDQTGKGSALANALEAAYASVGLPYDPTITNNMRGYYAFNSRRFHHAIHPATPGAIFETGFLTNPADADLLIQQPEIPAQALTQGIMNFFDPAT